jgi:carboxymethylenebutenolidase
MPSRQNADKPRSGPKPEAGNDQQQSRELQMGEKVTLKAADGFDPGAYVARPQGEPVAGLAIVQEIFGANAHIRSVADGYARDGFLAVAPALFDRIERNVELDYAGADMQKAMSFIPKLSIDKSLADIAAAMDFAAREGNKKVGVIGYCYGGSLAWLTSTRFNPAVAVGYYGGQIAKFVSEKPNSPTMLHFGRQDAHIPAEDVNRIHAEHPEVEIYWYEAGHGFNCDARASYNAEAARLARERSLAFLKRHLVG